MLSVDNDVLVGGPLDSQATHLSGAAGLNPWHPQADPDTRERYWAHREQTPWRAENALTHPMHEFFDGLRITRRERYASTSAPASGVAARRAVHHDGPQRADLPAALAALLLALLRRPRTSTSSINDTDDGSTSADGFTRVPGRARPGDHDAGWSET